jgi:hypothetical protein
MTTNKTDFWAGLDKDGDGDFDFEDALIITRDWIEFALPRIPIVAYGLLTIAAGALNISAWVLTFEGAGDAAIGLGPLMWFILQSKELEPIWDELSIAASLDALIRLQRKPLEIPVINTDINPAAVTQMKRFRDREKNLDLHQNFIRMACYGLELFVLVGGRLVSPLGVNWAAVAIAVIGFVGVELGLRGFHREGQKLLSSEERDYRDRLMQSASYISVNLGNAPATPAAAATAPTASASTNSRARRRYRSGKGRKGNKAGTYQTTVQYPDQATADADRQRRHTEAAQQGIGLTSEQL